MTDFLHWNSRGPLILRSQVRVSDNGATSVLPAAFVMVSRGPSATPAACQPAFSIQVKSWLLATWRKHATSGGEEEALQASFIRSLVVLFGEGCLGYHSRDRGSDSGSPRRQRLLACPRLCRTFLEAKSCAHSRCFLENQYHLPWFDVNNSFYR